MTHSSEVAAWADSALGDMGKLTRQEYTLIGLVLLSLCLWVFGGHRKMAAGTIFSREPHHTLRRPTPPS